MNVSKSIAIGFAGLACAASAHAAVINEMRLDQVSNDNQEYFELAGTPGESLNTLTFIIIGDGTGASGVIESVTSLASQSIPADGHFLVAETSFTTSPPAGWPGGTVDLSAGATGLNFENGDNVTALLVSGFTGASGNDLDTNDDGVLDTTPWTSIIDSVAIVIDATATSPNEKYYSANVVGPDGSFAPGHVYRAPDATGAWQIGDFDGSPAFLDTPGTTNVPEPVAISLAGLGLFGLTARRRRIR